MATTVRDMYESFKKMMEDGHADMKVFMVESASGVTGYANTGSIGLNEENLYEAGPLCEECIGEEVLIISVDC